MMKLYGCGSPNVAKVMLMLSELGLEHEFIDVSLYDGSLAAPWFRELSPNGRLPVLVDDGLPVFESGAILLYLAEKTGQLLPADAEARSRALQWLMWQMAGVGPMFGQALHFRYIAPDGNAYAQGRYLREVERLYDVAEVRLGQAQWFAGDEYSVADIALFPWLGRYEKTLGLDLEGRPRVRDWISRIMARPAQVAIEPGLKALFKSGLVAQQGASQAELDRFFGR